MRGRLFVSILAMAVMAGCGGGESTGPAPPVQPVQPPDDAAVQSLAPPPPAAAPEEPAAPGESTSPPTVGEPTPGAPREAATVGVGRKGQGYGSGPIATPVAAYFRTRQRLVFDVQIAHGMNTYYAINEHYPKTHEEFMEKIVKEGGIRLPELRPNERYVYDPEKAAKMSSTYDPRDPPLFVETTP